MHLEHIDTLVVGAGQAGLAMSEHLSAKGIPHLVLERRRIAERWRSERWDSLVANGPAWHDRFPSMEFPETAPNAFPSRERVAEYFEAYAEMIRAPIRCGVTVTKVEKVSGRHAFRAETSEGPIEAVNVVAATGPFQHPVIPALVPEQSTLLQIHSSAYRNPEQLPAGAVLVVGCGSSGSQIADELLRAKRSVYLSVGPHDRPPRSYRGHDLCWWLGVLGKWEAASSSHDMKNVTIAVSGARGGETVDFRRLAARGMTLVGSTAGYESGSVHFADDLAANLARADAYYLSVLDEADAFVSLNGFDLPEEPEARLIAPDPDCVVDPLTTLNLADAGITSIVWATGYVADYSWLAVDVLDEAGRPRHQRGMSSVPGIYFLGLPWQSNRGSSFIWGVWQDAKYLADRIAIRHRYLDHHVSAQRVPEYT